MHTIQKYDVKNLTISITKRIILIWNSKLPHDSYVTVFPYYINYIELKYYSEYK